MSHAQSTRRAGPSCPSQPCLPPIVTAPTQSCIEDEDLEITALTKKINVLQEKKAWEEEEQRRQEEEEQRVKEAVEKVMQEELERVKAVEVQWRVVEIV